MSQKTAWFLAHRIREACNTEGMTLNGEIEVDEAYFGGKEQYQGMNERQTMPDAARWA